ncbi:hypothetical protein ESZ36_18975 [Colwellia demingiae]|uniref:Uncharacterized protein n=1 Tax=Colwellia demingiae TaxID=89401 RepID=A0A5C6Q7N3_9GAMM|nr:hypothetical protein [Colwellia demingiae]TWX64778.1 hypothetical protein ESZ36_18975 [Colwellia demingiae]
MCSTPKPKKKVKGKNSTNVVSILSQMDAEKRKQFAERANEASERREVKKQEAIFQQVQLNLNKGHASLKISTMTSKPWHYWLISASFSEIFHTLFHKKQPIK